MVEVMPVPEKDTVVPELKPLPFTLTVTALAPDRGSPTSCS